MNPIDRFLSFFAPYNCVGCGTEGAVLCSECLEAIPQLPSLCYACGKATKSGMPCGACAKKMQPQHVWMYAAYKDVAKEVLHSYKFDEQRGAATPIASAMEQTLPYFAEPPLVTFVPTASSHRRLRGFDHAELLAKEIAKARKWHHVRLLHRSGRVRQLGATRVTRKQQLKGIFSPASSLDITGKHILLVDDVVTTGATIEACTMVLKNMGAARVDAVLFARTMEGNRPSRKKIVD